ncbi:MAG: hypothetical protein E7593_06025 [Ruminococcaceae bacterium]|nr:hypothetical protein [Oscillospiraceae bacterium]
MKKRLKQIVVLLTVLLCITLLYGCKNNENPSIDNKEPSVSLETLLESTEDDVRRKLWEDFYKRFVVPSWEDNGTTENNETTNRIYVDEFYNIDILINIIDEEEILRYTFNDFIYNYDRELPVIYQYIKGLDISKSDFIKANEISKEYNTACDMLDYEGRKVVYTDEQIEALYSEDKWGMFKQFGNRTYYYFDGKIYDYYEIVSLDDKMMEKMLYSVDYFDASHIVYYLYPYDGELTETYGVEHRMLKNYYDDISAELVYSIDDYYKSLLKDNVLGNFKTVKNVEEFYPGVEGTKEIDDYYINNLMGKTPAELDYLPPVYHLVEKFSLRDRKAEFYAYNEHLKKAYVEGVYYTHISDKNFELLFEEHGKDDIIKASKSPAAFYFEGVLYILKDLKNAESSLIDKMGETTEFKEYLLGLEDLFVYQKAKGEYGELVDGWLEKYYGIKNKII